MKLSKRKLTKIIKEEIQNVIKETSAQDFIDSRRSEINKSVDMLEKMQKVDWSSFSDGAIQDFRKGLERELGKYDRMVREWIEHVIASTPEAMPPKMRDVVNLAIDNMNRNGTEKRMVLQAIQDAYEFLKRERVL